MSHFTAKHYEAIAASIAQTREQGRYITAEGAINAVEADLIRLFEQDNPKFSLGRFLAASGGRIPV